jgi:hypothetical protein
MTWRIVSEALPREERFRLVEVLHEQGYTDVEIAERCTSSTYTATRIRRDHLGLPPNLKQERSPCPTSASPTQRLSTRSSGPLV